MKKYWMKVNVLEVMEGAFLGIPLEGTYQEETIFNTPTTLSIKTGETIEILCDEVVTLSLPPRRQCYEVKGEKNMIFNLIEFKQKFIGQFPSDSVKELEAIEEVLQYSSFTTQDAYDLGSKLYEKAKQHGDLAIRITREKDELPIFQLVMDSKSDRNLQFGEAKRQTVLKTGHCSLWALAKEMTEGGLDDFFVEASNCLPVGGAWPIKVNGELVATVFVSGLHEGLDQILILEALSEILNQPLPPYHGPII